MTRSFPLLSTILVALAATALAGDGASSQSVSVTDRRSGEHYRVSREASFVDDLLSVDLYLSLPDGVRTTGVEVRADGTATFTYDSPLASGQQTLVDGAVTYGTFVGPVGADADELLDLVVRLEEHPEDFAFDGVDASAAIDLDCEIAYLKSLVTCALDPLLGCLDAINDMFCACLPDDAVPPASGPNPCDD